MINEQRLWQAVVERAILAAFGVDNSTEGRREQAVADKWLRRNSKDFRETCTLAGVDPDFLREKYIAGKIDRKLFVSGSGRNAA